MVFSGLTFLYIFLPLSLAFYYMRSEVGWRNGVLITSSLVFYAWGEPVYILLMLATSSVNYWLALKMARYPQRSVKQRQLMMLSVFVTLAALGFFKYANFLIENLNGLLGTEIGTPDLPLPIGISFYSFQIITYVVDVCRGNVQVQRSYGRFLMYVVSFHQLVAGPIVRYQTIEPRLGARRIDRGAFSAGIDRFIIGLCKKVIFANACGEVCGQILDGRLDGMPVLGAWLGAILFTLQIYFDFSGYSDMAIGLGKMYGFDYPENFRYPYIAASVTEFWRRWHISLSTFFRDYVYIPMGGNRKNAYLNLLTVWFLTGLWHGASWNFVLWGLWFCLFNILERLWLRRIFERLPAACGHIYLLLVVVVGWVLFYYEDLGAAGDCLSAMFGLNGAGFSDIRSRTLLLNNLFLLLAGAVCATPLLPQLWKKVLQVLRKNMEAAAAEAAEKPETAVQAAEDGSAEGLGMPPAAILKLLLWLHSRDWSWLRPVLNGLLLLLCTALLTGESYNPFLYFRF